MEKENLQLTFLMLLQTMVQKIIINVSENHKNLLDKFHVENIVSSYSGYYSYPIELVDDEGKSETLNSEAIWYKDKKDITSEEYGKFFNTVAHVGGSPYLTLHNNNEGVVCFVNLIFIPSIRPFDLFNPDRRCSVKLYSRRTYITDEHADIIPKYLRFCRGIVDCSDLPLNISRETLQNNKTIHVIKNTLVKKIISALKKASSDDPKKYIETFWNSFGAVLKEGLCEPMQAQEQESILEICRFYSYTKNDFISLEEYIENKIDKQNHIYYLSSGSIEMAKSNPQLEAFANKGIDVLLFSDPTDDFWPNVASKYKDIEFKSVTRSDISLEDFNNVNNEDENDSKDKEENTPSDKAEEILKYFREVLKDDVEEVIISKKLYNSPVCLSVKEGAMDIRMERFMLEQKQIKSTSKKNLEINLNHPIIKNLFSTEKSNLTDDTVRCLYHYACMMDGAEVTNLKGFSSSILHVLEKSLV